MLSLRKSVSGIYRKFRHSSTGDLCRPKYVVLLSCHVVLLNISVPTLQGDP